MSRSFRQWRWALGARLPQWARWTITIAAVVTLPVWFPIVLILEFLHFVHNGIWD